MIMLLTTLSLPSPLNTIGTSFMPGGTSTSTSASGSTNPVAPVVPLVQEEKGTSVQMRAMTLDGGARKVAFIVTLSNTVPWTVPCHEGNSELPVHCELPTAGDQ